MTPSNADHTNRLLGYSDEDRLLIVNADDLGMCHAVNQSIFRSLEEGIVSSTSLMVPCPWALHAMNHLRDHPDVPFGVHLTFICDTENYRWGPMLPREAVPSLIDETGYFYDYEQIPAFLARVDLDELEAECRAQIEAVLTAGLEPTHLDWHCLLEGGSDEIFHMTLELAREYELALRVSGPPKATEVNGLGLPANDHDVLDSFDLDMDDKSAEYADLLRTLPAGLTAWAVHPGFDHDELRAIDSGWRVRSTDFEFLVSQEAREILDDEGITLLDYRALQEVWREERERQA